MSDEHVCEYVRCHRLYLCAGKNLYTLEFVDGDPTENAAFAKALIDTITEDGVAARLVERMQKKLPE